MEKIVAPYIPKFDEPANPYTGPEAGATSSESGGITIGMPPSQSPGETNDTSGTTVPSFMQCPEGGDVACCNGSTSNCQIPVNKMMFGMVHNAMSSEGELD